jgi:hypothetical protein
MADLLNSLYKQLGGVGLNASGSSAPAPYASPLSKPATPASQFGSPDTSFQDYLNQTNALSQQIANQNKLYAQQLAAQPRLLSYDYVGNQARARSQAEQAVNPRYTELFNKFLEQTRVNQTRQVEDTNTANKLLEESLANTQQGNKLAGERTTQDVATNEQLLGQQSQNFQQDTGQQFEQQRLAAARAGNVGGGLDTQQQNLATAQANTQESRQSQSFDVQKQAQELFKTRTFEDIARSNELATKSTTQGKEKNAIDLSRYIQDYGIDPTTGKYGFAVEQHQGELEQQRLGALLQEEQRQSQINFNNYVRTLKGARGQDIALTRQVYGL